MKGYQSILSSIYSSKAYYHRLRRFLADFNPGVKHRTRLTFVRILALFRSVLIIGILSKGRIYYWKLILWSLFRRPNMFPLAITYSIYGYHFRKVYRIDS